MMETETTFTYRDQFDSLNAAIDFIRAHVPDGDVPFSVHLSNDQLGRDREKRLRVTVTVTGHLVGPFQFVPGT